MADGVAPRGPLVGGDWLEGRQYAPLSVASYALSGRALVEQGVAVPWLATWNHDVLHRYARVNVSAERGASADTCRINLATATGTSGFASHPLVFTLDASCNVAEETSQPPVIPPEGGAAGAGGGGGNGGNAGASGSGGRGARSGGASGDGGGSAPKTDSGCGCSTINARPTPRSWLFATALVLACAWCRVARRRRHPVDARKLVVKPFTRTVRGAATLAMRRADTARRPATR